MKMLIFLMILLGSLIMVLNIYRYIIFIYKQKDIISANQHNILERIALELLVFFLIGYIVIGIFFNPDTLMAGILLGGSVFVAILLTLMFNLLDSAKKKGLEITELLISVIEARDPNLNGHSLYVQNLTMLFYEYLPTTMKHSINPVSLKYASLMHDVGKLGVPEAILNKPDKLTNEEWNVIRSHPEIALHILKPLDSFNSIQEWILYHHERIDGKGYYSISQDKIPLPSKIIAIADTYSAITMRRAYKNPRTHEEAISIIKEVAGSQLDKELVDIFSSIPKDQLIACAPDVVEI